MSIQRPAAALTLEGGAGPFGGGLSLAQAAVQRLQVDLSVDEGHDRVQLWLRGDSSLAEANSQAALGVGIGDGDDVQDVLTVEVAGVDRTPWGAVLTGYAPSRRLSDSHVGRSYVDTSLADVVDDLLAEADVDEGDVDADLTLPVLHIDPARSIWAHLHRLADRTGRQVTSTAAGAVSFTPIPGATGGAGLGPLAASASVAAAVGLAAPQELRQGAELVGFRAWPRTPGAAAQVVTPSAGSGPRWHLLAAEPDPGSGAPVLVDPMLRTREAAEAASVAYRAAAGRRARTARVTVPGRPDLRAGATVTALDEAYRVLAVRHLLDARAGYRCDLVLEADR